MFIAVCLIIVHALCILANSVISGRLTGLFAMKSFGNNCDYQNEKSNIVNTSNYNCPLGIEVNPFNYDRLHKLVSLYKHLFTNIYFVFVFFHYVFILDCVALLILFCHQHKLYQCRYFEQKL
jgi:hypothetical protein